VWDSGRGGSADSKGGGARSATADFLAGMIGSLPQVHELARQAGVELPGSLGRVVEHDGPAHENGPGTRPDGKPPVKPAR
jgi:flotillin